MKGEQMPATSARWRAPRSLRRTRARVARAVAFVLAAGWALTAATPATAATYVPISGAGSTWSANAVQQWAANVRQSGMTVNFQANGSTQGRALFTSGTVDFAVSEIPYGMTDNGQTENAPVRSFAYMPIVAGGTSFMYNLKIGGKRVTNLRLSGETVTKIFTGAVRTWNDPAVKADNPGLNLPARKIIPVVRSDGSGTTAQFTLWMSKKYSSLWDSYCRKAGRSTPCGLTSFYPMVSGLGFTAQNGSVGVAGYTASDSSEGAITYVEYSYALNQRFPVAKLLNRSRYYVAPTAEAVAVGLLGSKINTNAGDRSKYLTQILDGVYDNADPRAYPLSSYSYMILPTKIENGLTTQKGNTLADFSYYFLCEGQQLAPRLGYSPLPINLVKAGLEQVKKIPGVAVQNKNIAGCHNPTFSTNGTNTLAQNAPQPPACDKQGATQCSSTGQAVGAGGTGTGSGGTAAGAGAAGTGTGLAAGPSGAAAGAAGADGGNGAGVGGDGSTGEGEVSAMPVTLASDYAGGSSRTALIVLAVMLLIGVTVVPPLIARRLDRGQQR